MQFWEFAAIFGAGIGAGAINAVAGGGTLLSFPVLIWAGRDPVLANATNALALWPGSLAGAWGFRRELGSGRALLRPLVPAAVVGGVFGGWLLLATPARVFGGIVPFLILAATALVAGQGVFARASRSDESRGIDMGPGRTAALLAAQLAVSTYGGYFGAGIGILMIAALGLYGVADIHQRNGIKNLLSALTNVAASGYFVASGAILWSDAGVLAGGAIIGGALGARVGRRLSRRLAELVVVAIGLGMGIALFVRR